MHDTDPPEKVPPNPYLLVISGLRWDQLSTVVS